MNVFDIDHKRKRFMRKVPSRNSA